MNRRKVTYYEGQRRAAWWAAVLLTSDEDEGWWVLLLPSSEHPTSVLTPKTNPTLLPSASSTTPVYPLHGSSIQHRFHDRLDAEATYRKGFNQEKGNLKSM